MGKENKGKIYSITIPAIKETNIIVGQAHFIKTVEDIYEAITSSSPHIKFGIAFNEASGDRLVRFDGNDETLKKRTIEIAEKIGCGHVFVILLRNGYPINVLGKIKNVDEVVNVYVATANDINAIIYKNGESRAILGIADGKKPLGVEKDADKEKRHKLLRDIGYKR